MIKVEGCSKLLCLRFPFLPENVIVHTTRLLTLFYTTGIQLDNSLDKLKDEWYVFHTNIGDSGRFLASMLDSYANI